VRVPSILLLAVLVTGAFSPASAQSNTTEQELMQIRQKMSRDASDAINKKDAAKLVTDHYSTDVILSVLSPAQTVWVGRDALLKRWQNIFEAGSVTDYSSAQDQVHIMSDGVGSSTGTYTFTAVAKDGSKRKVTGHWLDIFRREADGEWRVSFQAVATVP
jgi:ketosteroid isomerase-like protein